MNSIKSLNNMNPTTLDTLSANIGTLEILSDFREHVRRLSCSIDVLRSIDTEALDKISIKKVERVLEISPVRTITLPYRPNGDIGRIEFVEKVSYTDYAVKSIITSDFYSYDDDLKVIRIHDNVVIDPKWAALINYLTIEEALI
jgi:hypothetical protein